MLQDLTRFMLDKIAGDYKPMAPNPLGMEQVLTTSATTAIRCMNCRSEYTRAGSTFVNDLLYPSLVS